MKDLYKKALEAYTQMLMIHIDTKNQEKDFHETTGEFYEVLFNAMHTIWEKHVDLGGSIISDSLVEQKKMAYDIIKKFREDVESYADKKDISLWTEDLLWSLANSLEKIEGTAFGYIKKK